MITIDRLSVQHRVAEVPVAMPIRYLQVIAAAAQPDPDGEVFNLPYALSELLYVRPWALITRIVAPTIWAPGWSEAALEAFLLGPYADDLDPGARPRDVALRPDGEGWTRLIADAEDASFEIVHLHGASFEDGGERIAVGDQWLGREAVEGFLETARTRLLILQTAELASAAQLGAGLVERGGPAVLAVEQAGPGTVQEFFTRLLLELVHNVPLERLAGLDGVEGHLVLGDNARALLDLEPYLTASRQHLEALREEVERRRRAASEEEEGGGGTVGDTASSGTRGGGGSSNDEVWARIRAKMEDAGAALDQAAERLDLDDRTWDHESEGVVMMAEASEALEAVRSEAPMIDDAEEMLEAQASEAPRVLNAHFRDLESGQDLGSREALGAGREAALMVDVGPKRPESVVTGKEVFPELALPPEEKGYLIDVMLAGAALQPPLVAGQLWVPRLNGPSYPVHDGHKAEEPGLLALRFRLPAWRADTEAPRRISARLNLYYETNLIQSASVEAYVAPEPGAATDAETAVDVDFVLSGTFQALDERFRLREVRLGEADAVPVALSLAMNGSDHGDHRILVKHRRDGAALPDSACAPHAWTDYDPQAGAGLLKNARTELFGCIYAWNDDLTIKKQNGRPVPGLNQQNGKSRAQFTADLSRLAPLGAELWAVAFSDLRLEDDAACNNAQWQRQLAQLLASSSLVQIGRTAPVQYVFPWALLYDIPLIENEDWALCKVTDEWAENGLRAEDPQHRRTACPHASADWHRKNVLCPYGFWGLKHLLEYPLSRHDLDDERRHANDARATVRVSTAPRLGIGRTEDPGLDQARIDRHIAALAGGGLRLDPHAPATTWGEVRAMLRAPEIVYFLCHGERDEHDGDYLSIGPGTERREHRIYARGTLAQWVKDPTEDGPDVDAWKQGAPLVFINGCHTSDLEPGDVVSYTSVFNTLGANGVLGTEVSMPLGVATEVAEQLYAKMVPGRAGAPGMPVGQALREVRWELANKGNLLGLAYTLYGLSGLRLTSAA